MLCILRKVVKIPITKSRLDAVPSHSIYLILASFDGGGGGGIVNEKSYKFAWTLKESLVGEVTKSFLNVRYTVIV